MVGCETIPPYKVPFWSETSRFEPEFIFSRERESKAEIETGDLCIMLRHVLATVAHYLETQTRPPAISSLSEIGLFAGKRLVRSSLSYPRPKRAYYPHQIPDAHIVNEPLPHRLSTLALDRYVLPHRLIQPFVMVAVSKWETNDHRISIGSFDFNRRKKLSDNLLLT